MPLREDEEKQQQGLAADLVQDLMGAADMMGGMGGNVPKMEGFIKGIGALESRFSRLVDVMDDFYSRMDKMAKGEIPGMGGGSQEAGPRRGDLFRGDPAEQRRVLEYMKQNQGKQGVDAAGRRVEVGAQGIGREVGYHADDIKAMQRMAERGRFGDDYKSAFNALRDANLGKQAPRQNVEILPAGARQQANLGATAEKIVNSLIETVGKSVPGAAATAAPKQQVQPQGGNIPPAPSHTQTNVPRGGQPGGSGGQPGGSGGQGGQGGGFGGRGGEMDLGRFMQFASPFSPMSLAWSAMFGMSGQLFPAFQQLAEPSMVGGEWVKQGVQGTVGFGASFTGLPALGKLFQQVAGTDAFELYESMHSSFTVLKNVYKSQEKASGTIQQSIQLARQTPLEVNDLLKIFSTFSVNPQLRNVLSNKEQMGQLATGVAGLSFLVPEQGTEGAIFAIREALAGQYRSIRNRFNINPELIASSGGMSMSEMKAKPTNFLGALDSFLKQNLGQQTFTELQNTFTKQVGNIYDSLTGGIFKSFRQGGMYEGATGFAAELANTTGKMFDSDMFGNFFKNFGGKVTDKFTQATNVLKSIDFDTDAPEDIQNKFTKGVTLITKDLINSIAPDMENIIAAVSPAAKSVGGAVSNAMSKSVASIFGGAIGIGVNSIVSTLEMPFEGVGNAILPKNWKAAQSDFIMENPAATFAGGYLGSKALQKFVTSVSAPSGGFKQFLSDTYEGANTSPFGKASSQALDKMKFGGSTGTAWRGVAGLASLPLLYKSINDIMDSFKELPDVEAAQTHRFEKFKRGKTKISEYQDIAFQEVVAGSPYKTEDRGLIGSAGMGASLGFAAYSMMKNSSTREGSLVNKIINTEQILKYQTPMSTRDDFGGNRRVQDLSSGRVREFKQPNVTQAEQEGLSRNERGRVIGSKITDMVWDERDKRFLPSKRLTSQNDVLGFTHQSVRPTQTPELKQRSDELMGQLSSNDVPENLRATYSTVGMGRKNRISGKINEFGIKLGEYLNTSGQSMPISLSKAKIQELHGVDADVESIRASTVKELGLAQNTRRDPLSGQQIYSPKSRLDKATKWGGIGAAVLGTAAIAGMDAIIPDNENLTKQDAQSLKRWTSFGQGLTTVGSMAMMSMNPVVQAAGGIAMGAGFAIDMGARAGYGTGLFGDSEKAIEQKGNREYRLGEVNKKTNEAIGTIVNNRVGDVKDFSKLSDMKDVLSTDWGGIFNKQIDSLVSSGKISQDTGNRFKTEIPKLARGIVEGRIKENALDIKQMLEDNDVEISENMKSLDSNNVLQGLITAAKSQYVQAKKPGALQQINEVQRNNVAEWMSVNFGTSVPAQTTGKANLQGTILQKADEFGRLSDMAEKGIAIVRYQQKGGMESFEESQDVARTAIEQQRGKYDVEGAYNTLKQYSLPREQFLSDKVFTFKEDAKEIFGPDMIQNMGGAIKSHQAYLQNTYQKSLLFHTNPTKTEESMWIGPELEKSAPMFTDEWLKQEQNRTAVVSKKSSEYVGVMPFLQDQWAMSIPTALNAENFGNAKVSRLGQANKSWESAVTNYDFIDSRAESLKGAFDEMAASNGVITGTMEEKAKKVGQIAMKNLLSAATEGFSFESQTIVAGDSMYEKKPTYTKEEVEKKTKAILEKSGDDPVKFRSEMNKLSQEMGQPEWSGDDKKLSKSFRDYEVSTKVNKMFEGNVSRDVGGVTSDDAFLGVIRRNLSQESAVQLASTGQHRFQEFSEAFQGTSNRFNYGMQTGQQLLGGGWAGGGAQGYRFVDGKLMETTLNAGGHEMPSPWLQRELNSQRQDQKLSRGTKMELNAMGEVDASEAKTRYARVLNTMEGFQKIGGKGLSQASFQVLDQVRAMAGESGATLGGDLLGREAILRKQFTMQQGDVMDEKILPAFERGDTEFVNQLMKQYGVEPANFKEGASPMEGAAQMSGIGEALTAVGTSATNLATVLNDAISKISSSLNELEGSKTPDGNKQTEVPKPPTG